ncbi:unnamed protein product [Macrosiphum euphorbiae]|uniref:Uncharacterized protein n=1 Tax=Macrosiphum euphorbiae TaxID=13131 RepID=A0AAV0WXF3_9HEMI|nr:unnamed protein product [Macrosiphum euphorbiae]
MCLRAVRGQCFRHKVDHSVDQLIDDCDHPSSLQPTLSVSVSSCRWCPNSMATMSRRTDWTVVSIWLERKPLSR